MRGVTSSAVRPMTVLMGSLLHRVTVRRLLWALAGLALLGGLTAWAWPSPTHYAYGPLRDCLGLRGGLVTVANGNASEATATVQVGPDRALIALGRGAAEAKQLAAGYLDAATVSNLVIASGTLGPNGFGGTRAVAAVRRCLSDAEGPVTPAPLGYRFSPVSLQAFGDACTKAHASMAQCRCVLTAAQSILPDDIFQQALEGTTEEGTALIYDMLDRCRLVG